MPHSVPNSSGPIYCPNPLEGVTCFQELGTTHAYRVWHEDWYCLCLVKSGDGDVRYRNRTLRFEPDKVYVFAPGEVHETLRVRDAGSYRVVMIPASAVHARAESLGKRDVQLPIVVQSLHPLFGAVQRLTQVLFAPNASPLERDVQYEQLLATMVANDERGGAFSELDVQRAPRVVEAVHEYLLSNESKNLKLADVSRALGWSAGYISRVFSEHGYCPPQTMLRLRRVGRARRMLVDDPTAQIKNAAFGGGFRAVEKFNAAFRVAWNMTPTEYRRQFMRS